ncbi:uncharacterized protein BDFB_007887 [Asbolus verrucosus]|uniref:Uncharacterized protein n=1 Tax=Asbolus verrucosus TaxID=1661398 RepID=A0A482W4M8_ASBVE|nr:uncharacterized protein BDFB_007887 [Asbolus verrucosus]
MSIKIFFGPYESHGVIRHNTRRLFWLASNGYRVELIPTRFLDVVTFEIMGKQIYRCNIKSLMFNMAYEDDPVAQRIFKVINDHKQLFHSAEPRLNELGYEVELVPSSFLNLLQIELQNKRIFRGDIRNLMFNMDCEDDPVAKRIIGCIAEARQRFDSIDNVPRCTINRPIIFEDTRDYLSEDVSLMYEIPAPWSSVKDMKPSPNLPAVRVKSKSISFVEKDTKNKISISNASDFSLIAGEDV